MQTRIEGLDVVRAIAILLVVWVHSTFVFPVPITLTLMSILPGQIGVSIFFVLSGYLIGGILLRALERPVFSAGNLGQFWIRRWFRTLPNYFLVLIFLVIYDYIVRGPFDFSPRYLVFAQNLINPNPVFFPEAWSLSVEEWFYLTFPALCYLGCKVTSRHKTVILALASLFIIAPVFFRFMAYWSKSFDDIWMVNYIVKYRFDALMYGVLGAYIHRYKPQMWHQMKYPGIIAAVAIFIFIPVSNYFSADKVAWWPVLYYCLESFMTLVALPYFSGIQTLKNRRIASIVVFISTISYAMYILNLSVIQRRLLPDFASACHLQETMGFYAPMAMFVLFWVFTIAGAYLVWRYFERPMTNLRDSISVEKK